MLPKKWPLWLILPIGLLLVAAAIGLGLGLVMAVQAAEPAPGPAPTATPPAIRYAALQSQACTTCHADRAQLARTAADEAEVARVYVDPATTQVLHGRLGCVTCHRGAGDAQEPDAAHSGMFVDPSVEGKQDCLYCHRDLPNQFPDDKLIAPHDMVQSGTAADLYCSDCHGSAGHGYDPVSGKVIISMSACLDCHRQRNLKVQVQNCDACHTEIPPWTPELDCNLCHSLDGRTYADTLQDPNLMAGAHAEQGLTCLDCHELAGLEQVHAQADYSAPVEPRTFDDQFCLGCHVANEHTTVEQVVERTADREYNPHTSHLVGAISCNTCHQSHEPSVDYCAQCHGAMATGEGWIEAEALPAGVKIFDPAMDCTSCKSMVPYVESQQNPDLLAYAHAQAGAVCVDCHEPVELEEAHLKAKPGKKVKGIDVDDEFCLGCHIPNEHSSYEQLIERTKDKILDGEKINPHNPHDPAAQVPGRECYYCHQQHQESPLLEGCYGCHHSHTFVPCSDCHKT